MASGSESRVLVTFEDYTIERIIEIYWAYAEKDYKFWLSDESNRRDSESCEN